MFMSRWLERKSGTSSGLRPSFKCRVHRDHIYSGIQILKDCHKGMPLRNGRVHRVKRIYKDI